MTARIYRPPKKKREYKKNNLSETQKLCTRLYNSTWWRKTRKAILMEHPLCQICEENGKIKFAEHIHHKKEFLSGVTEEEREKLFYDLNNLIPVC